MFDCVYVFMLLPPPSLTSSPFSLSSSSFLPPPILVSFSVCVVRTTAKVHHLYFTFSTLFVMHNNSHQRHIDLKPSNSKDRDRKKMEWWVAAASQVTKWPFIRLNKDNEYTRLGALTSCFLSNGNERLHLQSNSLFYGMRSVNVDSKYFNSIPALRLNYSVIFERATLLPSHPLHTDGHQSLDSCNFNQIDNHLDGKI